MAGQCRKCKVTVAVWSDTGLCMVCDPDGFKRYGMENLQRTSKWTSSKPQRSPEGKVF